MSKQGTWANNLIIQGVAESLKFKITIIESDPNFADLNIIEATNSEQQCVTVYIVSTKKLSSNAHVQQPSEDSNNILSLNERMRDMGACIVYINYTTI